MKVRDVMHSPPQTCSPDALLSQAASQMLVAEVGTIVVVDGTGAPIGMVTDRDLGVRGYARGLAGDTATVSDVMSHALVTANGDADVFDAAATMAARGIRRLPVVDGGRLVGMVALDDLTLLLSKETAEIARAVAAQADAGRYAGWSDWDMD
jgi:CBS domain-containing protein